jgi:hypothetical protein
VLIVFSTTRPSAAWAREGIDPFVDDAGLTQERTGFAAPRLQDDGIRSIRFGLTLQILDRRRQENVSYRGSLFLGAFSGSFLRKQKNRSADRINKKVRRIWLCRLAALCVLCNKGKRYA